MTLWCKMTQTHSLQSHTAWRRVLVSFHETPDSCPFVGNMLRVSHPSYVWPLAANGFRLYNLALCSAAPQIFHEQSEFRSGLCTSSGQEPQVQIKQTHQFYTPTSSSLPFRLRTMILGSILTFYLFTHLTYMLFFYHPDAVLCWLFHLLVLLTSFTRSRCLLNQCWKY